MPKKQRQKTMLLGIYINENSEFDYGLNEEKYNLIRENKFLICGMLENIKKEILEFQEESDYAEDEESKEEDNYEDETINEEEE